MIKTNDLNRSLVITNSRLSTGPIVLILGIVFTICFNWADREFEKNHVFKLTILKEKNSYDKKIEEIKFDYVQSTNSNIITLVPKKLSKEDEDLISSYKGKIFELNGKKYNRDKYILISTLSTFISGVFLVVFLIDFLIDPHIILSADEDGLTPFSRLPYYRKKILWNHIDRIDRTVYVTLVSHQEMLVIYLRKNSECHYPSNPFSIILKKNLTHHGNADKYIPLQKLVATDVLKALMPYLHSDKNDKT